MTSETPDRAGTSPTGDVPAVPAVAVHGITKTYGTVHALLDVDLRLRRGTVHGLVGENGSGKSTLTKVIAGVVSPDSGHVEYNGERVEHVDPRAALRHGVRVIYQDLAVFPNMTVAENLVFEGNRPLLRTIGGRGRRRRAIEALDTLGLQLDPEARLGDLSTAERQLVAIARTVSSEGRIVLMDEPTASLTHDEIDQLLETVRGLSSQGLSFLFISHKLREVVSVADDVTVIRDGEVVSSGASHEYDQSRITHLMTGGVVDDVSRQRAPEPAGEPVLQASGLSLSSSFRDIDLSLHPGRVVGLAGLVGSGRTEIGLALVGLVQAERGEIRYHGKPVDNLLGLSKVQYVPDDRLTEGLLLDWSIADNVILNNLDAAVGRGGTLSTDRAVSMAESWRERLRVKAPDVSAPVFSLSGGNQQRVLLARALAPDPDVIVLNNPTVGVDVGSRSEIHQLVRRVADDGTAILLISDEPAELLSLCDELVFIHDGRAVHRCSTEGMTEDDVLQRISNEGAAA
ncbi:sugar ABC transporter ATP-binding protein [Ornithinicoccus halotolerans]|uniref:sugar ABC transporter ATP-binding protein n=1 Tax=Ornithinicoccus halotolerans TaxID=1748220 RepID=UPI001885FB0B|nr:sugar ABC transporter ATP-binding protein [Ornithinicoccus halotolerans]